MAACDLLKPAQLSELGFIASTAKAGNAGPALTCAWESTDSGNAGGLQIRAESHLPVLDDIYAIKDSFVTFEPTEISGHPAIHADQVVGGACTIYTAIADYQILATDGDYAGRSSPDKCAPSRRMAEMILSNLPPLR